MNLVVNQRPKQESGGCRPRQSANFALYACVLGALALTPSLSAANQWFVSTAGSPAGDGSNANPWDLQTALNQPASVVPGDTIWLRGGVYHSPISNGYASYLNGTSLNPIVVRNYNNERVTLDGYQNEYVLAARGSYTWYWGLEIMDSNTNKTPNSCDAILGYSPHPSAFGIGVYGPANKFINLIVHDTAQGFSAYDESPDSEFNGNLSYYNGNGPYPACPVPDRNHGHGMYLQNVTGLKTVQDNIIGDNADEGIQMYGGGASNVQGFRVTGNALYNTSSWPITNYQFNLLVAGGAVRKDIQVQNNFSYFTPAQNYGFVSFGQYTPGLDMLVNNNIFVGGFTTVSVNEQAGPFTFTNNKLYTTPSSVKQIDLELASGQTLASYTWDNNAYYGLNNFLYLNGYNFNGWQAVTGFDTHSVFTPNAPTGIWSSVRPNTYESKRANIILYNWDLASSVSVDLSGVLAANDQYVVLDAQNVYGPPVAQGVYAGPPALVSIPMTGLVKAQLLGVRSPPHTAPQFGTFIVMLASSVPAPVGVSVTPPNTTLLQGQSQQFTATVRNTSDQGVTWSVSPAVGSISSSGLYTAPAALNASQTVSVIATSTADPSRSFTVTVNLVAPITVSVAPSVSLGPGQTKQFIATVANTSNPAVTWAINPPIGSLTSTGFYTAPSPISAIQIVTITATSVADTSKTGSANITLQPVTVTVSPANITLFASDVQQFTSTVTGADNTAVTWTLPSGIGQLSNSGLYTAPAPINAIQTVSVIATSVSDNSKFAAATITLSPPVTPTIVQQPPSVFVLAGQTVTLTVVATGGALSYQWWSQPPGASSFSLIPGATSSSYTTPTVNLNDNGTQFLCVVTNVAGSVTSNAGTVNVVLGTNFVTSANLGTARNNFTGWVGTYLTVGPAQLTVTSLGRMFAPGNSGTHVVKLVSAAGVDVPGGSVSVAMTGGAPGTFSYSNLPGFLTLPPNTTYYLLSQEVSGGDQWYDWDSTVQTTAVATVAGGAYGVPYAAIPSLNHMYGPLDIRYSPTVSVSPSSASLYAAQSQQFTATMTANGNTSVTWSLNPVVGSISSTGLYTAPASITNPQTITVTATSVTNSTWSGTATITLNPPIAVSVSPAPVTLFQGQTQQFTANVQNTANQSVQWSINPALGTITPAGLYTAPTPVTSSQTVTVTATSVADGTTFGTAIVTLAMVPVSVGPPSVTLGQGQTQQFTANQSVTWSISPSTVGGISTGGLYTAPATVSGSQLVTVTATSTVNATLFATASITLTPPIPPVIVQQPPNQTVTAGQPAVFAVVATGPGLSYQWQSMPSGAGSFSPIPGAVSNSYTMSAPAASDNGTQFRCVVSNITMAVTSSAATLTVLPVGANFVLSTTLGQLRNNFTGWVGMKVTIGNSTITINALGRINVAGNAGSHTVKVVDASTGIDVPGASAVVNTILGTVSGSFLYSPLASSVALNANHAYYIVSQETLGGDQWYDLNTTVQTGAAATVNGPVYGTPYVAFSAAGNTYVPVDFRYVVPVTVTTNPGAAQLGISQTQQFTATVTGSGNTAVNWTINPVVGTVAGGLYTAPSSISSSQTVTVTATSVADPSQSSSATVTLQPVVVTTAPPVATLLASQTQQFTATVTGTSNTAVNWTVSPSGAGGVSSTGLYTAPLTIGATQTVTVTATSVADGSKFATSTITLSPPATPIITQQPQSASATVGQTATFTVTATNALTYQWQSKPSGAGSFSNIPGANASTYTTPATTAGDNGTQVLCVVSNGSGPATSNAATLSVVTGTHYVTSNVLGTARNNYTGWVGAAFTVGSSPLTVTSLGRMFASGNSGTHTVKIVNAAGVDVAGGTTVIAMTGGTPGAFMYGALAASTTLNANTTYYILSLETLGADSWYDYSGTTVQTTNVAAVTGATYGGSAPYVTIPAPNHMFVPLDFLYVPTVSVTVNPPSTSLSSSQTQQFTATGDTSFTWTLSPNVGGISGTGFFTAPSSIASIQIITVTATSVTDPSKFGSAAITLNPPAAPSITQQPQSATVTVGQTATFSIAATGAGLTYQWQIKPSGAGAFSSILGAAASSYTTPATALADDGTQFLCVVSNTNGNVPSAPATLSVTNAVAATASSYVMSTSLGSPRNNYSGWVGMSVTVGVSPLTVTSLGRVFASGNTGTHTVKIVNAATGADVAGGAISISMGGGSPGSFVYGNLQTAVVLAPNTTYYVLSQETSGGDQWYDYNTTAQTAWVASLDGAVYGTGAPYTTVGASAGHLYVPVDFKYTVPPTPYVLSTTLGTLRNNYTGWVGMAIAVGNSPVTVSALGRYVASGNSGSHLVKLVNASTGSDLAGGSVIVNTATGTAGSFAYSALPSAVTLNTNTTYYILSQETQGGDSWYDLDTRVQSIPVATISNAIFGSGSAYSIGSSLTTHSYGPLDFKFQ